MQIAYSWLLDYLPQPIPVEELSNILTSIGLEVEAVEKSKRYPEAWKAWLLEQVVTCVPHPNADKLSLTTVNVGKATFVAHCLRST